MAAELMEPLANELKCPICLSVMACPVARLPCCHYFCQECITVSVRHNAACPVCKEKVGRRDIAADPTMDRVIRAFLNLHDLGDQLLRHPERLQDDEVSGDGREAIFWLQGVEDEELNSHSQTMSGSALDRLRQRRGARRAASPPTVHNSPAAAPPHIADTAAQAAATVAAGGAAVASVAAEGATVPTEQAPTAGEESGDSLKENHHAAANAAPPAAEAPGQQPPPEWKGKGPKSAAAQREAAAMRKRRSEGTQSIQRWLKKTGPAADEAGPSAAATAATVAPAPAPVMRSKAPPSGEQAAGEASQASSLAADAAGDAAEQLDNILAGLDDGGETPPALQAPAPQSNAMPAAPTGAAAQGGAKAAVTATGPAVAVERRGRTSGEGGSGGRGSRKRSASLAPGEGGEDVEGSGGRRRIPTRLLPWSCCACTFENKGGDTKCGVCGIRRGPGSANAAAPEADAAAAAVAAEGQQQCRTERVRDAAPEAAEADASMRPASEAAQRQSKQAGRKVAKRRKGGDVAPPAAAAEPAAEADEDDGGATWRGGKEKWVLLGSALDSAGKERLRRLAAASGSTVADKWSHRVTHVVCGTARRTFKLLMGLLAGKWVVSEEWAGACLAARSAVPEGRHSVQQEEGQAGGGGARRGRPAAGAGAHLLRGFEVVLEEAFARPDQVKELLSAAGARALAKLPACGKGKGQGTAVVLVEVPDSSEAAAAGFRRLVAGQAWYARACGAGVPVLSKSWLTDSISALEVRPMEGYRV